MRKLLNTTPAKVIGIVILLVSGISNIVHGQDEKPVMGLFFRPLVPSSMFSNTETHFVQNDVHLDIYSKPGFSAGGVMRHTLYKPFYLETGINYVYRPYITSVSDKAVTSSHTVRFISYEIPLQALIYIRTGVNSYWNNSFALSMDFFPNDIRVSANYFEQLIIRKSWLLPALSAGTGYEYRTKHSGIFCFGGFYHRVLTPLAYTKVLFTHDQLSERFVYPMTGHYFAIDVKYFFSTDRVPAIDDNPDIY